MTKICFFQKVPSRPLDRHPTTHRLKQFRIPHLAREPKLLISPGGNPKLPNRCEFLAKTSPNGTYQNILGRLWYDMIWCSSYDNITLSLRPQPLARSSPSDKRIRSFRSTNIASSTSTRIYRWQWPQFLARSTYTFTYLCKVHWSPQLTSTPCKVQAKAGGGSEGDEEQDASSLHNCHRHRHWNRPCHCSCHRQIIWLISVWLCLKPRQGPRLTWIVRRENEPLKNRDFNFEGNFLRQQNFWRQKLYRIGISHAWIENFGHFEKNSFTHLVAAALCLPSTHLAIFQYTWICWFAYRNIS